MCRLTILSLALVLVAATPGCTGANKEGFSSVVMPVEYQGRAAKAEKDGAKAEIGKLKPEPVYSTSFAINLAELALKGSGVEFSSRNVMVSYCDGVYTVTFEKPLDDVRAYDYSVDIDAGSSKVLRVVTAKR